MTRFRLVVTIGLAALVIAGVGVGMAVANGESSPQGTRTASPSEVTTAPSPSDGSSYTYYRSMMGRYGSGSMMGGSVDNMMSASGYRWMMGGTAAPGWMNGGELPGYMMGTNTDAGEVMGALFANAPGPRISSAQAAQLGNEMPTGATDNGGRNTITFSGQSVHFVALASPSNGPDETFRIAGLVNPTIVVHRGARVGIEVVNADPNTAHGLVVTANGSTSSWMPMMTAGPAFNSAALWFLGNPTSAGMHVGMLSLTAETTGTYQYLCPVPGHAQKGMAGSFVVVG